MTSLESLVHPLAGGILIGLAAGLFMLGTGRIAGISGIAGELLGRWPSRWPQSLAFIAGLPGGFLLWRSLHGQPVEIHLPHNIPLLAVAGFLVGLGTRLGSGCTSGHGVCGLARLSPRSLTAAAVFIAVAALTATVMRGVMRGLT
ncbi:MAG TPA: hypothetical protein VM661_04540 [Candidatus Sulfotelmatobacter sp.]|jgi:uncharacterized membrane protein YedE/YeeE|nr:hypothetical protein [Candidatus Sulfotelmatobacter sp.]